MYICLILSALFRRKSQLPFTSTYACSASPSQELIGVSGFKRVLESLLGLFRTSLLTRRACFNPQGEASWTLSATDEDLLLYLRLLLNHLSRCRFLFQVRLPPFCLSDPRPIYLCLSPSARPRPLNLSVLTSSPPPPSSFSSLFTPNLHVSPPPPSKRGPVTSSPQSGAPAVSCDPTSRHMAAASPL